MPLTEFIRAPRVAYFSMEIALRSDIPTYAGGLGILAGDTLRTVADLELPVVGVSLLSRSGYFRQEIDANGQQIEHSSPWRPEDMLQRLGAKIAIDVETRQVWIGAWLYVVRSPLGGCAPVLLLDTDLPENAPEDRDITQSLYGGDELYRLKQEMVLGIGGVRLLHALGFTVSLYHMNEGHSALLGLELLRQHTVAPSELAPGEPPYDIHEVRALCRFTTHTPVDAGHDRFPYELVQRAFGSEIELDVLRSLAGRDRLNMTQLALNLSEYVNGVAKSHAERSSLMFPGHRVHAVTNGIHSYTWAADAFKRLYDRYIPGWHHEPELLARAECCIPDEEILAAHRECKRALIDRVRNETGVELDANRPIIGFSRRMTAYKRPDLLFSDLARLRRIAREFPMQIVLAGKAHPHDGAGKGLIRFLHDCIRQLRGEIAIAFLPDYDMSRALTLVAGADVWLNTPLRPLEASGTSGMKAALNGVPSLSVLDGWWIEGCIEGVTGWAVGNSDSTHDARSLYDKLERVVLPLHAHDSSGWVRVMKGAIGKNAAYFHSHRMMRRYGTEVYFR
jgi:starch phosphorylase